MARLRSADQSRHLQMSRMRMCLCVRARAAVLLRTCARVNAVAVVAHAYFRGSEWTMDGGGMAKAIPRGGGALHDTSEVRTPKAARMPINDWTTALRGASLPASSLSFSPTRVRVRCCYALFPLSPLSLSLSQRGCVSSRSNAASFAF